VASRFFFVFLDLVLKVDFFFDCLALKFLGLFDFLEVAYFDFALTLDIFLDLGSSQLESESDSESESVWEDYSSEELTE
jgi:hypothetical protein